MVASSGGTVVRIATVFTVKRQEWGKPLRAAEAGRTTGIGRKRTGRFGAEAKESGPHCRA